MWCNPSLLPLGHMYDLQEGKNKREREREILFLWEEEVAAPNRRIWQLVPWLAFLPYNYFLSWLRGSSKPKVSSAGGLYSSGPQTLMCNRTIQLVASADFSILLPEMQDWWVWGSPGICIKCANLRSPDGGGLWITLGEPHLCPPWWTWVDNTNLLLWTLLCSFLGMKWAIWLMETISIHLPWMRRSLLVYFLSFPSWAREEIPNCLILYVRTSSGSQIPFDDKVLCKETFVSQRLLSF